MTARQQIARLLPLVLLVVLVIAGLRGVVPAPRWNGPLKADGVAIGLALEVVFGVLLLVVRARDASGAARGRVRPYNAGARADIEPPQALRFTLKYVLCAVHARRRGRADHRPAPALLRRPARRRRRTRHQAQTRLPPLRPAGGGSLHIPLGPILYALLIVAIVAAVAVSIWWSTRLRRPAAPAGHRGREHRGTARGRRRGPGRPRRDRRRQGGDHRLLRGDGTPPRRPGHRARRRRHAR